MVPQDWPIYISTCYLFFILLASSIYGHFCIKLSVLCLSPSVCSSIGIACSFLFLLFMFFIAEFWSLRVAPQPMLADSLLSGCLMVLVLQCAAQPLQVECYSIKLASS